MTRSDSNTADKHVPIVCFFGTKGGVGKTTIVDKFATLISRAPGNPNVLLVDFDVHHRGLTILRTRDRFGACKTIHEYLADASLEFSGAQDVTPLGENRNHGRQFLIPSSGLSAEHVFATLGKLNPLDALERIKGLLNVAAKQHQIAAIVIDCGPIVDPLTAGAACISDMAFIVGQNEPISFQALQNYSIRIRDFFPDYDASRTKVLLNKVRGRVLQESSIYAVIPFTMEVIDYSEGLQDIDAMRLVYFDRCVYEILCSAMADRYPELVPNPDAVLTETQFEAVSFVASYPSTRWFRRIDLGSMAFWLGLIVTTIGILWAAIPGTSQADTQPSLAPSPMAYLPQVLIIAGIVLVAVGAAFLWKRRGIKAIMRLWEHKQYGGILDLLKTPKGRKRFAMIHLLSDKTKKEATP